MGVGNGGGRLVAATVALLEGKREPPPTPRRSQIRARRHSASNQPFTECRRDGNVMCDPRALSSTDSGRDDHFVSTSSNSSTSDHDHRELVSVCCSQDLDWMGKEVRSSGVRTRRGSSLERRAGRRERDTKARSAHCWAPPAYCHDCRFPPPDYYHYFRPCDCAFARRIPKPTSDVEEEVRRLEGEKESLSLQVGVLTDQVDAQADKITDLERSLSQQRRQLTAGQDALQREMLTRSSLETQKLELLAVVSELKRQVATLDREILELRAQLTEERRRNKPPIAPRNHIPANQTLGRSTSPSSSPALQSPHRRLENTLPDSHKAGFDHYRSLPRESSSEAVIKRSVAFGKTTLYSDQARCSSVPNLAEAEMSVSEGEQSLSHESSPSLQSTASKGIRRIFGKLKRSGSGNLDDLPASPGESFIRGGVRSTAGPRLYSSNAVIPSQPSPRDDVPMNEWSLEEVCAWLSELGLDSCASEARRWGKNGAALLALSPQEVDKELNIKSGLLRKKVQLRLQAERGGGGSDWLVGEARLLSPAWVLRWLDDVGLPQYKNQFREARIDGHVLHRLTMDDLVSLHVTSALHVASIRAAIHVLRKEKFDGECLIRRSDPESEAEQFEERVELWTNHRVMEWLRLIDLAEYAPNLRGSGVHGALMVHEERFNDVVLASVLSIPPEKSLLRRHLSTHFKQLLGPDTILVKRQAESALGYTPLTPTTKIKIPKRSQFTLKRKKTRWELDDGELVCPLGNESRPHSGDPTTSLETSKGANHTDASLKSSDSAQETPKEEPTGKVSHV